MLKSNKTGSVKSVCRRCGKEALADEFVLDPVYKMMVCPACVKERKSAPPSVKNTPVAQASANTEQTKTSAPKPAQSAPSGLRSLFGAKSTPTTPPPAQSSKPADWDDDDEYLERTAAKKQAAAQAAPKAQVTRIDDEHVKITCPKCNYEFKYSTYRHHPASCPYCGKPIKQPR